MISFGMFEANRNKGISTRRSVKSLEAIPVGGFVVGVSFPSLQEAKSKLDLASIPKTPILWDKDDIQFLLQFPMVKWKEALWWRYGPGLVEYSKSQKNSGDVVLGPMSGNGSKMTFKNVNMHMEKRFEQMQSFYGFDLENWSREKGGSGEEQQWSTHNYIAPTAGTINQRLMDWYTACPTGFLGQIPDAKFSVIAQEDVKRQGKPSKKVLTNWNGDILNFGAGGLVLPAYQENDDLPENAKIDSIGKDGSARIQHIYYDDSGSPQRVPARGGMPIPQMLPGAVFEQPPTSKQEVPRGQRPDPRKGYLGYVDATSGTTRGEGRTPGLLTEAFESLLAEYPELASKPIITKDELSKLTGKSAALVLSTLENARKYLPGSGEPEETKQFTIEELRDLDLNAKMPATAGRGQYDPGHTSMKEEHVKASDLKRLGMTREQYDALVRLFFISSGASSSNAGDNSPAFVQGTIKKLKEKYGEDFMQWQIPVLGPDGHARHSEILPGLLSGIANARENKTLPENSLEEIEMQLPEILDQVQSIIANLGGVSDVVSFMSSLKKDTDLKLDPSVKGHNIELAVRKAIAENRPSTATMEAWSTFQHRIKQKAQTFLNQAIQYQRGGEQTIDPATATGQVRQFGTTDQVKAHGGRAGGSGEEIAGSGPKRWGQGRDLKTTIDQHPAGVKERFKRGAASEEERKAAIARGEDPDAAAQPEINADRTVIAGLSKHELDAALADTIRRDELKDFFLRNPERSMAALDKLKNFAGSSSPAVQQFVHEIEAELMRRKRQTG